MEVMMIDYANELDINMASKKQLLSTTARKRAAVRQFIFYHTSNRRSAHSFYPRAISARMCDFSIDSLPVAFLCFFSSTSFSYYLAAIGANADLFFLFFIAYDFVRKICKHAIFYWLA